MSKVKLELSLNEATALLLLADRPEDERREILRDAQMRSAGERALAKLGNARGEQLRIYGTPTSASAALG